MNTFGGKPLGSPEAIRDNRERFRREAILQLALANSLYVPIGQASTKGWILLKRKDYDAIRGYGNTFQLATTSLTFKNLVIVQARCVTTGLLGDPNAIYLVELTDQRGLLVNEWFQNTTNSYYNVLAPAYPTLYYANSLNAGSPWTWSTLVGDLWAKCQFLGTYPGLPSTPSGTPTNWAFPGVSVWRALCTILKQLGMGVSCDLTLAAPYGIVALGGGDSAFDTLTTKYASRIQDDLDWIDSGSGRVPGTVVVYFQRINVNYGTEETVRRDSLQWSMNAVYSVSISAPTFFTGALGTHGMYDDFRVRYDNDGNPIAADVATATAIAAERVQQYYDDIYSRTSGYMNRTYAGDLPFYAGSQVDGVYWSQDESTREGWKTQIFRGAEPSQLLL